MKILFSAILTAIAFANEELIAQADHIFSQYDSDQNDVLTHQELTAGLSKDMNFP